MTCYLILSQGYKDLLIHTVAIVIEIYHIYNLYFPVRNHRTCILGVKVILKISGSDMS